MAYEKQLWVDDDGSGTTGSPFDAERMNHIEDGIADAAVEGPPGPPGGAPAQYAPCTALTGIDPALGFVQITGLTLVAPAAASYMIQAVLDIEVEGANGGFNAYLFVNDVKQDTLPYITHDRTNAGATLNLRTTVTQQWSVALEAGDTVSIKGDATNLWATCFQSSNLMMYTAGAGPKGDQGDQGDQGPAGDNAAIPMDTWHVVGSGGGEPGFGANVIAVSLTDVESEPAQATPAFRKFPNGVVQLRGAVRLTVAATGGIAFILPVGYRPPAPVVLDTGSGTAQIKVLANGRITTPGAIANYLLDGLVFDTETVVNMPSGPKGDKGDQGEPGSGAGHVIQDEGVTLTQRAKLNFKGTGVLVTDDAANDASVVTMTDATVPMDGMHQIGTAGEMPFGANWGAVVGCFYRKDPLGKVQLHGKATNLANFTFAGTNNTLFTLPLGYRPFFGDREFKVLAQEPGGGALWVCRLLVSSTDGSCKLVAAVTAGGGTGFTGTIIRLDEIDFDTGDVTQMPTGPQGPAGPAGAVNVQDEGGLSVARSKLNIIGSNIRAVDDAANDRINIIQEIPLVTSLAAGAQGIPNPIPAGFMADVLMTAPDTTIAMWRFRYRPTSVSGYKWECIGSPDIHNYGGNLATNSTAVYVDLTGGVQNFICPIEAEYLFRWGCQCYNTVLASQLFICLYNATGGAVVAECATYVPAVNVQVAMGSEIKAGFAAGTDIRTRVRVSGGSGQFLGRYLAMRPVRAP